jgi:hypothetical protein
MIKLNLKIESVKNGGNLFLISSIHNEIKDQFKNKFLLII